MRKWWQWREWTSPAERWAEGAPRPSVVNLIVSSEATDRIERVAIALDRIAAVMERIDSRGRFRDDVEFPEFRRRLTALESRKPAAKKARKR